MNNAPAATLSVCTEGHNAVVRIAGRANFTASVDFKKLVLRLQERGCTNIILDLTDCLIMDSTFLGVLAGLGFRTATTRAGLTQPTIELYHASQRVSDLIDNLGVTHLYKIVQCPETEAPFLTITPDLETSRVEVTRTCLEAHRKLMEINPANVSKFKDVTQFFADDLKKQEDGNGSAN